MEPFSWQLTERKTEPPPLPASVLRRFRAPLPASVLLAKSRPTHFRSAKVNGTVHSEKGPYLASGNWWDEHYWDRAEWDLELETGALCQCHASGGQWALDGIYD
jgi:protein ImuB